MLEKGIKYALSVSQANGLGNSLCGELVFGEGIKYTWGVSPAYGLGDSLGGE